MIESTNPLATQGTLSCIGDSVDASESYTSPYEIGGATLWQSLPSHKRPLSLYALIGAAAILVGFACSILFGDAPGAGANISLCAAAFVGCYFLISRTAPIPLWRKLCAGAALFYGCASAFRASDILFDVNILLMIGFTGLACTPAYSDRMKAAAATVTDLVQTGFNAMFGSLVILNEIPWSAAKLNNSHVNITARVLVGLLISAPFLLIFGLLFARAELRFGQIFGDVLTVITSIFDHFWITFWATMATCGLLRSAFTGASMSELNAPQEKPRFRIGMVESATVLSLLTAMFLLFVITQLPYLFGGQDRVTSTPGLPWSQYARQGFFELAWVAGLLIPTLMLFLSTTNTNTKTQKKLLQGLCLGLSLLGGIIVASALNRMLHYTTIFGLTELRLFVSAFIVMLAGVLILLNLLYHLERSALFLPLTIVIGVLFSTAIQIVNVQGMVAHDVITRYESNGKGDVDYLETLSSDAVPTVLDSALPASVKVRIVSVITKHDTGDTEVYRWLYHPISVKRALANRGK